MNIHLLHGWLARGLRCAMVAVTAPDGERSGIVLNEEGACRGNGKKPDPALWAACLPVILARLAERAPFEFTAARIGADWVAPAGDPAPPDPGPHRIRVEPMHETARGDTVILGTSSVAVALARLCLAGGFPVRVLAEDGAALAALDLPAGIPRRLLPAGTLAAEAGIGSGSHCVVLTEGHRIDEACVEELLRIPEVPYIGWMCGPDLFRAGALKLRRKGLLPDPRFFAPVGVRLGGLRAADIALSILAEIRLLVEGGRLEFSRREVPAPPAARRPPAGRKADRR